MIKVLLTEDEESLAMIVRNALESEGFDVAVAGNGSEGLKLYAEYSPDIVVTDVMMPVMDGFEMVRRIRKGGADVPVLFLTARSAVDDVVTGFEAGANDYLKKPFAMRELIVRIRALAGRSAVQETAAYKDEYRISSTVLDTVRQKLTVCGHETDLSHRECQIMLRLCHNANRIVTSRSILLDLWGDDDFFNARSLSVFITRLRHRLSADKSLKIINIRGTGYKLVSL